MVLLKIKEITLLLKKHNCLPTYHFLKFYNAVRVKRGQLSQKKRGRRFVNRVLPPFPSFNKGPLPSVPAMFDYG